MMSSDGLQSDIEDDGTEPTAAYEEENVDGNSAAQLKQMQEGAIEYTDRPLQPLYYARSCLSDLFTGENQLRSECSIPFGKFVKNLKQEDRFDDITVQLVVYLESSCQMGIFWDWLFRIRPYASADIANYRTQWERAVRYYKSSTANNDKETELQPGVVQPAVQDPTHPLQSGDKLKINEWFFETLSREEQSLAVTVGLFGGMKIDYLVELSQTIEKWLFDSSNRA